MMKYIIYLFLKSILLIIKYLFRAPCELGLVIFMTLIAFAMAFESMFDDALKFIDDNYYYVLNKLNKFFKQNQFKD